MFFGEEFFFFQGEFSSSSSSSSSSPSSSSTSLSQKKKLSFYIFSSLTERQPVVRDEEGVLSAPRHLLRVGEHRGAGAEPEAVAAAAFVAPVRSAVAFAADLCDRDRRGRGSFVRPSGAGGSSCCCRGREARAASLCRCSGSGALSGGEEGVSRSRGERGEAVASSRSCSSAAAGEEGRRRGGDAEAPGEGVGLRFKRERERDKRVGREVLEKG